MNKKIIFLYVVLFIIISVSLVFAQEAGGGGEPSPLPSGGSGGIAANYTAEYDPSILEAFKNQTWLPVLVRLRDNSNTDDFLNSLSKNDFKGERGSSKIAFVGFITKNGFETLLNDSRVKSISWTKYDVHTTLENQSKFENVSEIEKGPDSKTINNLSISKDTSVLNETNKLEGKNLIWLWLIIFILIISLLLLIIKIKKR